MPFIESLDFTLRRMLEPSQTAYKVPQYQRPYAWQEDQWEDLLDDVESLMTGQELFLGSVVVIPKDKHRAGINYFEVVDGQQRLATLLIWFSAIRDSEIERGNQSFAEYIDTTFLFIKEFVGDAWKSIPKLTLGEPDNDTFLKILNRQNVNQKDLIFECYNFFRKKASKSDLLNILLDRIFVIHINAMDNFNAFRLFETLNDRGLELSAVDLIKNFILMRLTSQGAKDDIVNQTIHNWNEMYQKIGNDEPVKFIRRYTMSRYKGKVAETKLYETIKTKTQNFSIDQIVDFVRDINSKASIYKKIINKEFYDQDINRSLSHLSMIEVGPSYTLLMKLFSFYEEGKIQKSKIIEVLDMIETFHIRWGICGQATAALDQIYSDISSDIGEGNSVDFVRLVRERFTKELKSGAEDITFERNFKNRSFRTSELRTKYILWKLSDPTGETIPDINSIETEHIMPQTLSKEWYDYLIDNLKKSPEEIKVMLEENLNRIGNLTIMKDAWNTRDSNKLFDIKKSDYQNSEFVATKNLANFGKWTFDEIEKRSTLFSKKALEKWPWKF